jgi:tetratricopeptide (TPR) repeat protein
LWIETGRFVEYGIWSESLIKRIDEHRYPEVVAPLLAGLVQVPKSVSKIAESAPVTMARIERAIPLFESIADYVSVVHLHAELCDELEARGQFDKAEKVGTEALRISEMHNLERSYAYVHVLGVLANTEISRRRTDEGRAYATRALKILPPHDRRWRPWLMAILAMIEFCEGNTARALELTEATWLEYSDGWPGRALVRIRSNLSAYHLLLNHLDAAAAIAREVLADSRETFGDSIQNLAVIATLRGEAVSAARVLGFLEEWHTRTELCRNPLSQATFDVLLRVLRERLSEDAIDRLKAEGREMSIDQAIDEILQVTEEPAS